MPNDPFYTSDRWRTLRGMALKRDGYMCQFAIQTGHKVPAECVHHIFPREQYPEYQYKLWNLISLSYAAHNKMHIKGTHKLSDLGEALRKHTEEVVGLNSKKETIVIIGYPGSGRRQWTKEHMQGGLVYDLDGIAQSLRLGQKERYWPARRMANDLARGFAEHAHSYTDRVLIIRTAPTTDELWEMDPTLIVVTTDRGDADELPDERRKQIAQRLADAKVWAERNNIEVMEI